MSDAYARARRLLTLAALLSATVPIAARPLLVAPKQHLDISAEWRGSTTSLAPSIDGDTLLVSANRPTDTDGGRVDGVHLFQRGTDGTWRYVRALEEGQAGTGLVNGNLATVQVG